MFIIKLIINAVLIKPNTAPDTSSKKPMKVKSISFLNDLVIQLIIKYAIMNVAIIDINPINKLFDSGKNLINKSEKILEKFNDKIILTKKENKETKLVISPFLYPL